MSIVTRLLRWFAEMRRRFYGRFGSSVVVVTPPVTGLPGQLAFNVASQSGLLALLEDILT